MSHSCARWRGEIGACIVGALDRCARDRLVRHLAACAGCRADYYELVPVRDWLSLLAVTAGGAEPGPAGQPGRLIGPTEPNLMVHGNRSFLVQTLLRLGETDRAEQVLAGLDLVARNGPAPPAAGPQPLAEPLRRSELRVLRYLPTNLTAPEIASELRVSLNTVKTHMRNLYAKLGAHRRAEAVTRARDLGLLAPFARSAR